MLQTGWFKQKFILTILAAGSPKSKLPTGLALGETFALGLHIVAFLLCPYMASPLCTDTAGGFSSFNKDINSIGEELYLKTSFNLYHPIRTLYLQIQLHRRLNIRICGGNVCLWNSIHDSMYYFGFISLSHFV